MTGDYGSMVTLLAAGLMLFAGIGKGRLELRTRDGSEASRRARLGSALRLALGAGLAAVSGSALRLIGKGGTR
jgi:hypothetical protein